MKLSKVKELLKKLDAEAKKTNKAFQKASPAKKRVMVLEDALKQLRKGKYKAESGTYFHVESKEALENDEAVPVEYSDWDGSIVQPDLVDKRVSEDQVQLKSLIDLPISECRVCAIGGAFASVVRLQDKLKKDRVYGDERLDWHEDRYITRIFPSKLLHAMEEAFESSEYGYDQDEDADRLRAIYRNIIANDGKAFTYRKRMTVEFFDSNADGGIGEWNEKNVTSKTAVWSERGWKSA